MASILTIADFEGGELNVAGTEKTTVSNKVQTFINKYEPEYLLQALGYPLYKLFMADNYPTPSTQRFMDLLNGNKEYTDQAGRMHLWTGLKGSTPLTGLSPLAAYVWYWFERDNDSYNSVLGEVKGKVENSMNISPANKTRRAWNEMSSVTCNLWNFLTCAKTLGVATYPEFDICQVGDFGKITF